MPKVYLTLEEQRRAETERQHRIEDDVFTGTLRRARKAAGYTQRDLAKKVGYDPGTVGSIERNPNSARISQMRDICFALGIKFGYKVEAGQK